jgi:hypothetical protein
MTVSNPLIIAANLLLSVPHQESPSFVPAHANSAKEATALIVSSRMFAVRTAQEIGCQQTCSKGRADCKEKY